MMKPADPQMPDGYGTAPAAHGTPWRSVFATVGAPVAWVAQIGLSEPLSALACGHSSDSLSEALRGHVGIWLFGICIVCLLVAIAATYVACAAWRTMRVAARDAAAQSKNDASDAAAEDADDPSGGRREFMVGVAAMASIGFLVGVTFTSLSLMLVPSCAR
jgi:hypothetical protein